MAKFGKRSVVSNNIWDRTIGLIGESGIGKTTTMSEMCEKLVGADGYMILDMGKENGVNCLNNVTFEKVSTYQVWDEITKDIIENKETDYPNLKILVTDTYDQLLAITEPYAIALWNKANIGSKDFKKVNTLNASWGGFGRGIDKVIELIFDRIEKLRNVGVVTWICGHTKTKEITDPLTGNTYTSLTADATQKYFTAIKTKLDIVGVACINRDVVKEETNRKNIMTHKAETINKVVSENRVIKFRDDNYAVDSKSRLKHIVSEIPLDADAFIKAIQNAIDAENSGVTPVATVPTKKAKPVVEEPQEEIEEEIDDIIEDTTEEPIEEVAEEADDDIEDIFEEDEMEEPEEEPTMSKEELAQLVKTMFGKIKDADLKEKVKKIIASGGGLTKCSVEILEQAKAAME